MKHTEYAVVDIGSNSLRLMKGQRDERGSWHFSPKKIATTRLGKGLSETKHLSREGMAASLQVLADWHKEMQGVPVCAVATSAVREAVDGIAFLAEIRARVGWHCRAIAGTEEASLSFCGAASAIPSDTWAAVLDIGGGSSEVAMGKNGTVRWSHSYPLGAVRLTTDSTWCDETIDALRTYCHHTWLPMQLQPQVLIGVGGTLTSLAAMEQELTVYDSAKITGYSISRQHVWDWIHRLCAMTPDERCHVPGLQPKRSDIIIAGLVIAASFLEHYDLASIQISDRDLLEGVFYREAFYDAASRWPLE